MLEKQGIHTAIRRNNDGIIYGITYVDHRTKCVFNGSDLGKEYSAKRIVERCLLVEKNNQKLQQALTLIPPSTSSGSGLINDKKLHMEDINKHIQNSDVQKILEEFLKPELNRITYHINCWGKKEKKAIAIALVM